MTTASKHMGCLTVAFGGLGACLKKSDESCVCKPTGMPILRFEILSSSASSKPWAPLQQYLMTEEAFKSIKLLCQADGVEAPIRQHAQELLLDVLLPCMSWGGWIL
jgi:hypothetical protein